MYSKNRKVPSFVFVTSCGSAREIVSNNTCCCLCIVKIERLLHFQSSAVEVPHTSCVPPNTCCSFMYKNGKFTHVNISVYICIEACWVPGRNSLFPKDVVFTCLRESHLLESHLSFNKQTVVVLTSLYIVHQSLCFHFLLCLSPCFLGGAAAHSQSLYRSFSFGFFLVGQLCSDQIIFGPLPHPKIYHRDYIERIPLNAKMCGA